MPDVPVLRDARQNRDYYPQHQKRRQPRAAAEAHVNFTRSALQEIDKADSRLEISLRRIAGSDDVR